MHALRDLALTRPRRAAALCLHAQARLQTANTCTTRPSASSVPALCRPDNIAPSWTKITLLSFMRSLSQALVNTVKRRLPGDTLNFFLSNVRVPCNRRTHSRTWSSTGSPSAGEAADPPDKVKMASFPAAAASRAISSGNSSRIPPSRSTIVMTRASARLREKIFRRQVLTAKNG